MKHFSFRLLVAISCVAFVLFASCQPEAHVHTYSDSWSSDDASHWHAATCEHSTEVSGKADHIWGEGEVTKAATEETEGEKKFTCSVCNKTKTEAIEKLPHTHKYTNDWTSDNTSHWHAATCEHSTEVSGKADHIWNSGKMTKVPTENAEGEMIYTCTVCAKTKTEVIAKLEHTHQFETTWTSDETSHWYASTCGHDIYQNKSVHIWNEGTVTTVPTETSEGEKLCTCTICGKTKTFVIANLTHTHTFKTEWGGDDNYHWHESSCGHEGELSGMGKHSWDSGKITKQATETENGVKTYTCTVCNKTKTEIISKLTHSHEFDTKWSGDEAYHWHATTCGHNDVVSNMGKHTWNEGEITKEATETEEGEKTCTCSVCGLTSTFKIAVKTHVHTNAESYTYDETYHWHESTCGHEDNITGWGKHTWSGWTVTKPATIKEKGEKISSCVCGKTRIVEIDKLPASNVKVTVTLAAQSDITITKAVNETSITLTASSGYDSYEWKNLGRVISKTSDLNLLLSEYSTGTYIFELEAVKNGEYYSSYATVTFGSNN